MLRYPRPSADPGRRPTKGERFILRAAKRLIAGTRLEGPIKRAHHALTQSKNSLYDWQTIAIMARVLRPASHAIDIGAFEGGMLRHMHRLAPRGSHMAFEPQPDRCLQLSKAFPGAKVHPFALGDRPGSVTLYCMVEHPALSGLRRRGKDLPGETVREIEVHMETLDRVVARDTPVDFIKVDVEGGELGVFRGGIETLRRTRPVIVFECGLGGADHFDATPQAIFDLLSAIGLKVSLLGTWLATGPALSRQAFSDQFERGLDFYFVAHP